MLRGAISREAWQKGLEEVSRRERQSAERSRIYQNNPCNIAHEYNHMADLAEASRLEDVRSERSGR